MFYGSAEHMIFILSCCALVKIHDSFCKNKNHVNSLKMYILPVLVIYKDSCRVTVTTGCMLQLQFHAVEVCMVLYTVTRCKYVHICNYLFYSKAFKKCILIIKVILISCLLFHQRSDKTLPVNIYYQVTL